MKKYFALIFIMHFTAGCGVLEWKDRLLTSVSSRIPWSFEYAMGDQLLPSVLPLEATLNNPKAVRDLETLLLPITKNIQDPQIKIHISNDSALNAFAIPGGHLIFNQGMLMAAETPEEIVGVAAHEIAHATERHVMRSMIQGLSIYAIATLFFGDITGVGAYLLNQGQALVQSGFSRSQERDADEKGLDSLIAAKIDPRGMIRFFQRIQKESGPQESRVTKFLSSHPLTSERIEAVESRIKSLSAAGNNPRPLPFDLKNFQKNLAQ